MSRRIDRLLIDQHGVNHATHLDQLLPIPAVASEARDLACADGADLAEADFGNHAFEAGALHAAGGGATKIVINALALRPAELNQATPHGVLQSAALAVVQHLMGRGLPHIKQRLALQMVRPDLVSDHARPPSVRPGCRSEHAPGSAAPAGRSASPASPPAGPAMPASASALRRRTARSVGSGRFAEAFPGRSTSLAGGPGVAWASAPPPFWSWEDLVAPEWAAVHEDSGAFYACPGSSDSASRAIKPTTE